MCSEKLYGEKKLEQILEIRDLERCVSVSRCVRARGTLNIHVIARNQMVRKGSFNRKG
jgi:hypothetical protein